MLENERYAEAADTLRFLLNCQNGDEQYKEEWGSLLRWLTESFPELAEGRKSGNGNDEETDTEAGLLKRHVRAKAAADDRFADKLLDMLDPVLPLDKQLLALEQLIHVDHSAIGSRLRRWITDTRAHPLVQFRGLQVLRTIGETGTVDIRKLGQTITISLSSVPLHYEQFPAPIRAVSVRVRAVLESREPGVADYAESVWRELLPFVYGTSIYEGMLEADDDGLLIWAAALHQSADETMRGVSDNGGIMELYGLTEEELKPYQKAQQVIKLFTAVASSDET